MNHRYEDRSFERERGERSRQRTRQQNEDRGGEAGRRFNPGSFGFEEDREESDYGSGGSGGSRYGAAGYGRYSGQGLGGTDREYRSFSDEDYGSGSRREPGGGSWDEDRRYARQGGSSNWRQQREGGSYGGYGSTGDYGYGSQGRSDIGQRAFERSDFDRGEPSAPYYGTGNYSSGGSGLGGGYRGMPGMGAYGPGGWSSYGGSRERDYGSWRGYEGDRDYEQGRERRPGLMSRLLGRGPKGYKRSDERLREDVSERLMQSPRIDSSEVTVEVAGGVVTLTGTVPERYMKHQIEDLVDGCLGVQDIDNRIRVQREGAGWPEATSGVSQTSSAQSAGTSTSSTQDGGSNQSTTGRSSRHQ